MKHNFLSVIAGFLLLSPVVLGLLRGLPGQLEITRYRLSSVLYSLQWLLAYLAAPIILRKVIIQNPWHVKLFYELTKKINNSLFIWAIVVPIAAMAVVWVSNIFMEPLKLLIESVFFSMQSHSRHLSSTLSSLSAGLLQAPKGLAQMLIFTLIVHLTITLGQFPGLSQLANQSFLYHWADNQVITPILQLTVLNNPAWFKNYYGRLI